MSRADVVSRADQDFTPSFRALFCGRDFDRKTRLGKGKGSARRQTGRAHVVRSATAATRVGAVGSTQSCGLAEEEDKAEVLARIVLDAYPGYCEVRAVADGVLDRR